MAQHIPDDNYIDPDMLYDNGQETPFIYNNDGELLLGAAGDAHRNIISDYFRYYQDRYPQFGHSSRNQAAQVRLAIEQGDGLLGRLGPVVEKDPLEQRFPVGTMIISFWETKQPAFDQLLGPCLKALEQAGFNPRQAIISTPYETINPNDHQTQTNNNNETPPNNDRLERARLQRELHLLRGDEKKAAMKYLGVGARDKNAWQRSAEENDIIKPGHKFWAMHSESFEQRLNKAFQ